VIYIHCYSAVLIIINCIGGVMISVLASSVVDHGFEPRSDQTKNYAIGICCFSAKHEVLRRKSKDWSAWNQDNVSKWGKHVYPRTVVSVSYPSRGVSLICSV